MSSKGETRARSNGERVVKWEDVAGICERNEEKERESFVHRANHGDESKGGAAETLPPWKG